MNEAVPNPRVEKVSFSTLATDLVRDALQMAIALRGNLFNKGIYDSDCCRQYAFERIVFFGPRMA